MSGRGFSPGPWKVTDPVLNEDGAIAEFARVEAPEHLDCCGQRCTHIAKGVSTVQNADLISAAPELYEAAKPLAELISQLEDQSSRESGSFIGNRYRMRQVTAHDLRKLRQAVLKAEGS